MSPSSEIGQDQLFQIVEIDQVGVDVHVLSCPDVFCKVPDEKVGADHFAVDGFPDIGTISEIDGGGACHRIDLEQADVVIIGHGTTASFFTGWWPVYAKSGGNVHSRDTDGVRTSWTLAYLGANVQRGERDEPDSNVCRGIWHTNTRLFLRGPGANTNLSFFWFLLSVYAFSVCAAFLWLSVWPALFLPSFLVVKRKEKGSRTTAFESTDENGKVRTFLVNW
jgi:hypothetical protein